MKRKRRIWIFILLLVLAAIAAVVIWQWNNLRTVHSVLTTDEETAVQNLQTQHEKEEEILARYDISVRPPSVQQQEDLLRGRISAQEVKQQLGLTPSETPSETSSETPEDAPDAAETPKTEAEPSAQETPDDPEARAQAAVEACVRSLYSLQVDLIEQLGAYRTAALREWDSLSAEERTNTRKAKIVAEGMEKCTALEKQADADVRALLDGCKAELTELGAPTDVIDELWEGYLEEKEASKLYFLNQYL